MAILLMFIEFLVVICLGSIACYANERFLYW